MGDSLGEQERGEIRVEKVSQLEWVGPKRKWVGPVVSGNTWTGLWEAVVVEGVDAGDTRWVLPHSGVGSAVDFTRSTGKTKMDRF